MSTESPPVSGLDNGSQIPPSSVPNVQDSHESGSSNGSLMPPRNVADPHESSLGNGSQILPSSVSNVQDCHESGLSNGSQIPPSSVPSNEEESLTSSQGTVVFVKKEIDPPEITQNLPCTIPVAVKEEKSELKEECESENLPAIQAPPIQMMGLLGRSRLKRSNVGPSSSNNSKSVSLEPHHQQALNSLIKEMNSNLVAKTDPTKEDCHKFLVSLTEFFIGKPRVLRRQVEELIQLLIDMKIGPDEFSNRLQESINIAPQPCLIEFLKNVLPSLRTSMICEELKIAGIEAPPVSVMFSPQTITSLDVVTTGVKRKIDGRVVTKTPPGRPYTKRNKGQPFQSPYTTHNNAQPFQSQMPEHAGVLKKLTLENFFGVSLRLHFKENLNQIFRNEGNGQSAVWRAMRAALELEGRAPLRQLAKVVNAESRIKLVLHNTEANSFEACKYGRELLVERKLENPLTCPYVSLTLRSEHGSSQNPIEGFSFKMTDMAVYVNGLSAFLVENYSILYNGKVISNSKKDLDSLLTFFGIRKHQATHLISNINRDNIFHVLAMKPKEKYRLFLQAVNVIEENLPVPPPSKRKKPNNAVMASNNESPLGGLIYGAAITMGLCRGTLEFELTKLQHVRTDLENRRALLLQKRQQAVHNVELARMRGGFVAIREWERVAEENWLQVTDVEARLLANVKMQTEKQEALNLLQSQFNSNGVEALQSQQFQSQFNNNGVEAHQLEFNSYRAGANDFAQQDNPETFQSLCAKANLLNQTFKEILSMRNLKGDLNIDHKQKQLFIRVFTNNGKSVHQLTPVSDSDDIMAFFTVAYILALWKFSDQSLFLIDDFEFFMGMNGSHRQSMAFNDIAQEMKLLTNFLSEMARSKPRSQFLLFTPMNFPDLESFATS